MTLKRPRVLWIGIAIVVTLGLVVVASPFGLDAAGSMFGWLRAGDKPKPAPIEGADLGGAGPGSLISAMTMPEFLDAVDNPDLRAARVAYRSTNGDTGAERRCPLRCSLPVVSRQLVAGRSWHSRTGRPASRRSAHHR